MNQNPYTLEHQGLRIRTVLSDKSATLIWQGFCEIRIPESVLDPFLKGLVVLLNGQNLTLDFRLLEYANSATQAPILQFLKNLNRNQIPTRVLYNASLEWQRVSYRCMKALFRATPRIQFECV